MNCRRITDDGWVLERWAGFEHYQSKFFPKADAETLLELGVPYEQ